MFTLFPKPGGLSGRLPDLPSPWAGILASLTVACSSPTNAAANLETDESGDSTAINDTEAAIDDTEGTSDTGAPDSDAGLPNVEYDRDGCLTINGASEFCGNTSNGDICELAAECRGDASPEQCAIDCTMSTSGVCLTVEHVECVWEAFVADECNAIANCDGWALVY